MLLTIEKVLILKQVSIFADLPEEELTRLAAIGSEVEVGSGETIIAKGDPGTHLYVVATGQVRVHDGDRTVATLGEGAVFGELSVLDPEPRSASVTAVDDTLLFRIGQEALYELMADRPSVAHNIIRFLCRRFRESTVVE
jgi:CRP-like cAMP-binding protein